MPMPGYGCDELAARSSELAAFFARGVDEGWFEHEPDGSPELVRRLVPFGIGENGEYLAWDPADSDNRGEAAVYVVGAKFLAVRRAAADLGKFVAACLGERVKAILGPGYAPLPATFRPARRPS